MKKVIIILLLLTSSFSYSQTFNLNSEKFKAGGVYISNPKIFFDFAKWTIRKESYSHLDSIAAFLLINENLNIEIGTHTDSRGSKQSSMRLDMRRSESIKEYLTSKGISEKRLVAKGYSDTQLIISDKEIFEMQTEVEKEKAHSVNRRTEFKIIRIETD